MEFLDPSEKKARTIRLFTGYALLAVVVMLATTILVYQAQGFNYNREKGVTRDGLLFVDSKPISAAITMDGNLLSDKTNARLTIAEGEHSIKLTADKYRDWTKKFVVDGGSVKYLLYPRLFPKDIPVGITRVLPQGPAWSNQSPDRKWLVYQQKSDAPVISIADLSKPTVEPAIATISTNILPAQNGSFGTLKPQEWSDDNKHLLLLQTLPDGSQNYIQFNRENPDESLNVTTALKLTADQTVVLRDKKFDLFYVFSQAKGELRNGSTKTGVLSEPFVNGVVAFKPHAADKIMYATYTGAQPTQANIVVLTDQKNKFNLRPINRDPNNKYLLDEAKFDGDWYYIVGSPANELVRIYRNPLDKIKPNTVQQAAPQVSLRIQDPRFLSFSDNTRFISIQSGPQFVVYDAEDARIYRYTMQLSIPKEQEVEWMDGHRLTANSNGRVYVFDFDGMNTQDLVAGIPAYNAYFDRDYEFVYTLIQQTDSKVGFQNAQLILN